MDNFFWRYTVQGYEFDGVKIENFGDITSLKRMSEA